MNATRYLAIFYLMSGITVTAWSQEKSSSTAPATKPAATETRIPELKVDRAALEDVLEFLHDISGDFQPVIVRAAGAAPTSPKISMRVKNITIRQFLDFLDRAYGITSQSLDGPTSSITVITIPAKASGQFEPPADPGKLQDLAVRVYGIRALVEQLAAAKPENIPDRNKLAIKDILSLVQAALDENASNQGPKPVLKIHEETYMLLVKGYPADQALVGKVLDTLRPDTNSLEKQISQLTRERENMVVDFQNRVTESANKARLSVAALEEARTELRKLTVDNAVLKAQLEQALKSTTRPKE